MLTAHSTLALCSTVTMAEGFVLDRDCVALLCEEEEAFALLAKAAGEGLLKTHWRSWTIPVLTQLHDYQLHSLMERAQVHRTPPVSIDAEGGVVGPPSVHSFNLRVSDVLLLIKGSARGFGMKRTVNRKQRRRRTAGALPTPPGLWRSPALKSPSPSGAPVAPLHSSVPSLVRAATTAVTGPASRPPSPRDLPPPPPPSAVQPSPLYEAPCWLRRRRGRLEVEPSSIYLQWTLRDEEICTLFPPPARADMNTYAKQLGLTMRLAHLHHLSAYHHQHVHSQQTPQAAAPSSAGDLASPNTSTTTTSPHVTSSSPHPLLSRALAPSLSSYMGTLRRKSLDEGRAHIQRMDSATTHSPPLPPRALEEWKEGDPRRLPPLAVDRAGGGQPGGSVDEDGEQYEEIEVEEEEDEVEFDRNSWRVGSQGREARDGEGGGGPVSTGVGEEGGDGARAAFLALQIESNNARTI